VEYFFRFTNTQILFLLLFSVTVFVLLRLKWFRYPVYNYSLGSVLKTHKFVSRHKRRTFFLLLRFFVLVSIACLIGRPQLVDSRSSQLVEGIDMIVVLDVSGSMQFCDYGKEKSSRIEAAKQEAIRFIKKRMHDPIGLVIFGKDAVSRCPITADKNILVSIVKDLKIGSIDPDGTVLSLGILTAANRLKNSKSKSKVIIVLTDGDPSPNDESPDVAIEVAKRMGIKIYTVGIGSDKDKFVSHPFYGPVRMQKVNKALLTKIARETGGRFFLAENQKDMRQIYDTINQLEKTEYETDVFSNYKELFMPFLWVVFLFVFLEIILSSLIWFGI